MNTTHETDFYTWTQEQAALLRAGRLAELDTTNLIEEMADSSYKCTMGGKEGTVKNRVGLRLLKPKPTGASRGPTIILPNPIVA